MSDDTEVSVALIASLKALESMPFDCPPTLDTKIWTCRDDGDGACLAASGVAIRKLRTEYQVTSHVTRGANRNVRLAGARDSVDVASAYLQGYGTVISQKLPLEDEELGLLIGKKGVTIAQLQEKTNCSFVVDTKNSMPRVSGSRKRMGVRSSSVVPLCMTVRQSPVESCRR